MSPTEPQQRQPLHVWPLVAIMALGIAIGFASAKPLPGNLWDFGSFLVSGHLANLGLDPYDLGPDNMAMVQAWASQHEVTFALPNLNPPAVLPVFQLAALFDPNTVMLAWFWTALLAMVALVGWLLRRADGNHILRGIWGLGNTALWMPLGLGQVYPALAVLSALGTQLEGRLLLRGALIGCVAACKPNLLIWPLFLFVAGHRRISMAAFATFGVLGVYPLLAWGPGIYQSYFTVLAEAAGNQSLATNMSVASWLSTFLPGWAVVLTTLALLAAAGIRLFQVKPDVATTSDLAIALALALAPIAWVGYALLLYPMFIARRGSVWLVAAMAILLVPANWMYALGPSDSPLGPRLVYPLALVGVVAHAARSLWPPRAPD